MDTGDGRTGARRLTEVISLADQNVLDLLRARAREQEVLDILDDPAPTR
jgi:hypothetical protein